MVNWFLSQSDDSDPSEFLLEEDKLFIVQDPDGVSMDVTSSSLTRRHIRLIDEYDVTCLTVYVQGRCPRGALKLLRECPGVRSLCLLIYAERIDITVLEELTDQLRELTMLVYDAVDFSPVAKLKKLRSLSLSGSIYHPAFPLEISHLRLEECSVWLRPEYLSVLQCKTLKTLTINRSNYVKHLDLTTLSQLSQLTVEGTADLATMSLHPKCRLRAIKLGECSKLEIDPKRLFRDVRHLALVGRSRVSLADLPQAKHLTSLVLNQVPTKWRFNSLKKCKKLKVVDLFTGLRKKDAANERIVRQINKAGGFGPVLAPRLFPGGEAGCARMCTHDLSPVSTRRYS